MVMELGAFERQVYEQMIEEYPAMAEGGKTFTYNVNGRTFDSPQAVVYMVANKMWDVFDETLDSIEDKGEQYGQD